LPKRGDPEYAFPLIDVGTGAEVTNATNVSTLVVRVEAIGDGPF
jgi:hypothetical protein